MDRSGPKFGQWGTESFIGWSVEFTFTSLFFWVMWVIFEEIGIYIWDRIKTMLKIILTIWTTTAFQEMYNI